MADYRGAHVEGASARTVGIEDHRTLLFDSNSAIEQCHLFRCGGLKCPCPMNKLFASDEWVLQAATLDTLEKRVDGSREVVQFERSPDFSLARNRSASRSDLPQVPHSMITVKP